MAKIKQFFKTSSTTNAKSSYKRFCSPTQPAPQLHTKAPTRLHAIVKSVIEVEWWVAQTNLSFLHSFFPCLAFKFPLHFTPSEIISFCGAVSLDRVFLHFSDCQGSGKYVKVGHLIAGHPPVLWWTSIPTSKHNLASQVTGLVIGVFQLHHSGIFYKCTINNPPAEDLSLSQLPYSCSSKYWQWEWAVFCSTNASGGTLICHHHTLSRLTPAILFHHSLT